VSAPRVVTEVLGGGTLSRAIQAGAVPAEWVAPVPRRVAEWRAHATRVQARVGGSAWYAALQPAFAASGPAAARLARVAEAGGIVVTTGQQPGLFGGPLYTWLKALSALALADRIERETGVPAAPVFWAATDDADYAEASWTAVATDLGVRRLALPSTGRDGLVMAETPLGSVDAALEELAAAAASAPHGEILDALRAAYVPGATVGSAYVHFLRSVLEPLGVGVLDAWHPATLAAARPTLVAALQRAASIDEAVSLRNVAIERSGYRPQVARIAKLSLVFRSEAGVKARVPLSEALRTAGDATATLTANVLLRPLVEQAILPTVAYVAGPGELAYFAQVGAVAETLGVPAPVAVPRWSASIVDPQTDRRLGRLGLVVDDLRDPHAAERRIGDRAIPIALRTELEELRGEVQRRIQGMLAANAAADALIAERVLEGARQQIFHRLDRLQRRIRAAARGREEEAMADLLAVRAVLMPEGHRQERRLNLVPLLARHGEALLAQLRAGAAMHAGILVVP
jgi:bacillithiol biosynthesis cysteine-adding enzyme BshC